MVTRPISGRLICLVATCSLPDDNIASRQVDPAACRIGYEIDEAGLHHFLVRIIGRHESEFAQTVHECAELRGENVLAADHDVVLMLWILHRVCETVEGWPIECCGMLVIGSTAVTF